MATLLDLAILSSAVYDDNIILGSICLDKWYVIDLEGNNEHHYFGAAFRNIETDEIVIANRGTDPSSLKDLWSDVQLFAHQEFPAQRDAMAFALKVAEKYQGATIIETGHSLGGNEAAAAYAELCRQSIPQVSAVTFQAPGIPSGIAAGAGNDVLNIYNQGDLVRLVGGEHLGTSISIDAGPGTLATLLGVLSAGTLIGRLGAMLFGGKLVLLDAHSLDTTIAYLKAHPALGSMTHSQYQGLSGTISSQDIWGRAYGDTNDVLKVTGPDGFSQTISASSSLSGTTLSETITTSNGGSLNYTSTFDQDSNRTSQIISKSDPDTGMTYDASVNYSNGKAGDTEITAQSDRFGEIHSTVHKQEDGSLKDTAFTYASAANGKVAYAYDAESNISTLTTTNADQHWTEFQIACTPQPAGGSAQANVAWTSSDGGHGVDTVRADGVQAHNATFADGTTLDIRDDAISNQQEISIVTKSGIRVECSAVSGGYFVLSVNGTPISSLYDYWIRYKENVDLSRFFSDKQYVSRIGELSYRDDTTGLYFHVEATPDGDHSLRVEVSEGTEGYQFYSLYRGSQPAAQELVYPEVGYYRYSAFDGNGSTLIQSMSYRELGKPGSDYGISINADRWNTEMPNWLAGSQQRSQRLSIADSRLMATDIRVDCEDGTWNVITKHSQSEDDSSVFSSLSNDGSIVEKLQAPDNTNTTTRIRLDGSKSITTSASDGSTLTSTSTSYAPDGTLTAEEQTSINAADGSKYVTSFNAISNTRQTRSYAANGVLTSDTTSTLDPITGATTEVAFQWSPDGSVQSATNLTRNADGSITVRESNVSPNTDRITTTNASGLVTQIETIVTDSLDRMTTRHLKNLNPDGTVQSEVIETIAIDPVTGTTTHDLKNLGPDGTVQSEVVSITDSTRCRRITTTDAHGVVRQIETMDFNHGRYELCTFSADGELQSRTIAEEDGRRTVDTFEVTPEGSITTYQSYEWGKLVGASTETITTNPATGVRYKTVTETDSTGVQYVSERRIDYPDGGSSLTVAGPNGLLVWEVDISIEQSTGTRTEDYREFNPDGSLKVERIFVIRDDGSYTELIMDGNGRVVGHVVVDMAAGSVLYDMLTLNPDGTIQSVTIATGDANGNVNITTKDAAGRITQVETRSIDPSTGIETQNLRQLDIDGSLSVETITVINPDGSSIITAQDFVTGIRTITSKNVDDTSEVETISTDAATGIKTDNTKNFNTDGSLKSETIITTSADGMSITIQRDTDGDGVIDETETLVVDTNTAPTVAMQLGNQSATEDTTFSYIVPTDAFADVDADDQLTLSATLANGDPMPSWLTFDAATGTFSGTPGNDDVGNLTIQLTATDLAGASVSQQFDLTVANVNDAPTVATQIGNQSATEDTAFSYVVPADAFTDIDAGDQLTLSATLANGNPLPSWLSFDAATGTFSGTPTNDDVGSLSIQLTATDLAGASISQAFDLTVANVNDAPTVVMQLGNQSAMEDTAFSYIVPADAFADVDTGDQLTLSATLANGDALPSWLSFDAATRTFSGTPTNDDVGSLSIQLTATDLAGASASQQFGLAITNADGTTTVTTFDPSTGIHSSTTTDASGHVIRTKTVSTDPATGITTDDVCHLNADGSLQTQITTTTYPDGSTGVSTLNAETGEMTGMHVDANGDWHKFHVIPNPFGAYNQVMTNSDGSSTSYTWTAAGVYDISIYTADGTHEQYHINNNTGLASGSITDPSGHVITTGTQTTDSVTGFVTLNKQQWRLDGTLHGESIEIFNANGQLVQSENISTDPVTGIKTDDLKNFDAEGSLQSETITTTSADGKSITIQRDIDGDGVIDETETLMVDTNTAPTVAIQLGNQSATEDSAFNYVIPAEAFADVDAGDQLTLSATLANGDSLPSWLTFDAATGTFSGTPGNDDVGSLAIQLTATDFAGASVSQSFNLTIANVNDVPTVAMQLGNQSATEDTAFSYIVPADAFTDIDTGDQLTLSATLANGDSLPSWLTFDAVTGTFSGTPGNDDVGSLAIQLTATDFAGASVSQSFNLTIANVNDAPTLASALSNQAATEGTPFTATLASGAFADIDAGDVLTYAATRANGSALPAWLTFDAATRTFSGTPGAADVGSLQVRITATDQGGLSASGEFSLNIAALSSVSLVGTSGADSLVGTAGNDTLNGAGGDDTIDGGAGADVMYGGFGDDTFYVDNIDDVVNEYFWQGQDTVISSVTYTLGNDIENLTLTGTSAINGTGNAADNVLIGNSAANVLNGAGGNDTIDGGAGADVMYGGFGDDTFYVDNIDDVVNEYFWQGQDTVISSVTYTLGSDIENLTLTGTSAINGTGNAADNVLIGNSAANVLYGAGGNDTIDGGAGADVMYGGLGDDTFYVDNIDDVVNEYFWQGQDTVISSVTYTLGSDIENLTLTGTSAINGTGNSLANTLTGNTADNILDGGTGADTMIGGLGNDTYVVDNVGDVVTESASEGTDLVQSSVTYTLATNVENLTLTGTSAINGTGNATDNVLTGNSAVNTLTGNAGNDTLDGKGGNDILVGGTGNDIYVLGRGYGNDTVKENDATSGNTDIAQFLVDVATDQIWFRHVGNNLEASIIGTSDKLTIQNWYSGSAYQVEQFKTADGKVLLNTQVDILVQAMASFTPPTAGQTTLPPSYQTTLAPVIAVNWQ